MQEDSDEEVAQYEMQGQKLSLRDVQNILYFAQSTQLMWDSNTVENAKNRIYRKAKAPKSVAQMQQILG